MKIFEKKLQNVSGSPGSQSYKSLLPPKFRGYTYVRIYITALSDHPSDNEELLRSRFLKLDPWLSWDFTNSTNREKTWARRLLLDIAPSSDGLRSHYVHMTVLQAESRCQSLTSHNNINEYNETERDLG